ncbi:FAD-binding oxidoreductase [Cellulomonas sp. P22]|uniref:FAD-binding oxidoreductase n=1 Tax=Cellulomonas sp. P22 TaxID=3373189 RepID=UPI003788A26A
MEKNLTTGTTSPTAEAVLPSPALVDALRGVVRGAVVTPADLDWDAARAAWNVAIDQHPLAVVHPLDVADVEAVVRVAAQQGVPVSAQPRGHGATAALDGTILVRTHVFDDVAVDTAARTARVGAGVLWGRLLSALDGTGLVALAGSNAHVSVAGLTLNGGLSWFGRAFGTSASALRAIDLVTPDGHVRTVDADHDPDLFWALRGGGGDFGIVTAVEIDLFEAPAITGGRLVFPGTHAREVLAAWAELTRTAPDELTTWTALLSFPDAPFLPEEIRGQSFVTVDAVLVGTPDESARLLAPVRAAAPLIRDTTRPLPPSELGTVAEEPEEAMPALSLGQPLSRLDAAVLDHLVATAGPGSDTPLMLVQIRHLGGALQTGDTAAGAGMRVDAPYVAMSVGAVPTPALAAPVAQALTALVDGFGDARTTGSVLTFLNAGQSVTDAYDPATVARLRDVKLAVDPAGTIRSNYPVLD